jgi:hypothetical protein
VAAETASGNPATIVTAVTNAKKDDKSLFFKTTHLLRVNVTFNIFQEG